MKKMKREFQTAREAREAKSHLEHLGFQVKVQATGIWEGVDGVTIFADGPPIPVDLGHRGPRVTLLLAEGSFRAEPEQTALLHLVASSSDWS